MKRNIIKKENRPLQEKDRLVKRLNIINGQINGIKQMLENSRHCEDILIQISAVNKSLKSIGKELLKSHLNECVIADNKLAKINEIADLFTILNN